MLWYGSQTKYYLIAAHIRKTPITFNILPTPIRTSIRVGRDPLRPKNNTAMPARTKNIPTFNNVNIRICRAHSQLLSYFP